MFSKRFLIISSVTLIISLAIAGGNLTELYQTNVAQAQTPRPETEGIRVNRGRRYSNPLPDVQGSVENYQPKVDSQGQLGNNNLPLQFPLGIAAPTTVPFGWGTNPTTKANEFNTGADLQAPVGTPVVAAYPGTVAIADYEEQLGLTVVLRHEKDSQESQYAHLDKILIQSGEQIEQGQVIGLVGTTGKSSFPHLHFEWRQLTPSGWVAVDPTTALGGARKRLGD
ncbi:MAG: M23 family metallopeptidase [Spirulinaceae cyanobacterium]